MAPHSGWFWAVLAASVALFWALPRRIRYGFLGLVSAAYLCSQGPSARQSVLYLGLFLVLFWALTPLARPGASRQKQVVVGLILVTVGFLCLFKYFPGLARPFLSDFEARLIVPLGISYYTFKLVHYVAEVALGNIRERSFQQFLCWLFLFPTFSAGPIQRYDLFLANQETRFDLDSFCEGLTRIVHGLIKKFVVASWLWERISQGRTAPENLLAVLDSVSPLTMWAYVGALYLYIYFDFSGYSDLAIGASRLFGLRIQENFHYPLVANSIREYWRRWHMTLSGWCQSYVYMPVLGLYRKPLLSLYATFFVMGMWHSGTWTRLFWGLYHATGVALFTWWSQEKRRRRWKGLGPRGDRLVGIALTQLFVAGSMAFLILEGETYDGRLEGDTWGTLRILAKLFFVDLPA
jgi:alginate O-acetyltransferase complex protein AlgI